MPEMTRLLLKRIEMLEKRLASLEQQELSGFFAPTRTDANRGAAGNAGRIIFNSDDGQLNVDDGTNWTLPDGTTT